MNRIKFAVVLVFGLLLFIVPFASAHSFIDHCTPEVGSAVAQAPKEVRCKFTEAVDAKQTLISVSDAKNVRVDNKDLRSDSSDPNGTTVVETLDASKMGSGIYNVQWSTVSEDGDATDGQWQFAIGTQGVPSVDLISPTADTKFDKDPADVVVTIKANNFPLGQNGRRWQVYLDDKLVLQVTDNKTSATLKEVEKGDHALNVKLATDDKTVVATAGLHLTIGAEDQAAPAAEPPKPAPAPSTGYAFDAPVAIGIIVVLGLIVLAVVFIANRQRAG
jgi:methionine-rich copper-binding protein CopC